METKELGLSKGRKGVQLTLPSPSLSQSGHYACVAENRFERVEEKVLLTVFPPGTCTLPLHSTVCSLRPTWPHSSPSHTHMAQSGVHGHLPHANGTWLQRRGSANALNASLGGGEGGGIVTAEAVEGVLGFLLVVGLVAGLVATGVCAYRYTVHSWV